MARRHLTNGLDPLTKSTTNGPATDQTQKWNQRPIAARRNDSSAVQDVSCGPEAFAGRWPSRSAAVVLATTCYLSVMQRPFSLIVCDQPERKPLDATRKAKALLCQLTASGAGGMAHRSTAVRQAATLRTPGGGQ